MQITPINSKEDYLKFTNYLDSLYGVELSDEQTNDILVIQQLIDHWEQNNLSKVKLEEEFDTNEDFDYIFDLIKNVSSLEGYGLSERIVKLQEELGELSAETLKLNGFKHSNLTKEQIKQNILLEAVDCLIMTMDILSYQRYSKREIIDTADKQIEKWMSQLKIN